MLDIGFTDFFKSMFLNHFHKALEARLDIFWQSCKFISDTLIK